MLREIAVFAALVGVLTAYPAEREGQETPARPVGGYSAIAANIIYPEIALKSEVEGTLLIRAYISVDGSVTVTEVIEGLSRTGLDEAAQAGIEITRFLPAIQNGRPVGSWLAIPIRFCRDQTR